MIRSNVAEHPWPEVIERSWDDAGWIDISQVWGFFIPIFYTGFSLYTVVFLSIAIPLKYLTFMQEWIKLDLEDWGQGIVLDPEPQT